MAEAKQTSELDAVAQLRTFKRWFAQDRAHSAEWRKQARADYDFVAGDGQWSSEDRQYLQEHRRVPITFNYTLSLIEAVSGVEINGRHETSFLPRGTTPGVVQKNELLSSASRWMDDESDAPTAQSRAWQDTVKTGMGWTEAALSYDDEPDGAYVERRIDPLEMWWDHKAREGNLADAKRIWHVRSDIDIDEARAMFPDASDEDLDASWCDARGTEAATAKEDRRRREENAEDESEGQTVTIARIQWVEKEPYYRALIGGQMAELSKPEFQKLNAAAKKAGAAIRAVPLTRTVYKQAFIGAAVLSESFEAPCPHYTFNCITGKVHENKGTFYGLVHLVRDPQMWANKWLTQSLHMLNTQANGGAVYEADAFVDQRDAEDRWAIPGSLIAVTKGAMEKGKLASKPGQGALPNGHMQLMEFAVSAIRQTSGINLEIMGLREANQPGILEAQRKQAGMTILATMFDSLRAFRKRVGKVRLYYIQEYLADGRMVRVAGPESEQYVPLLKDKVQGRHDIIVGDAPTSPNQREQTWAQLQPMLALFKDMITPQVAMELLEYSPLPSAVVERIRKAAQEAAQRAEQDPEAQKQKQLAERGMIAEVEVKEATAAEKRASAKSKVIDASVKVADAEHRRTHPEPRTPVKGRKPELVG